MKMCKMCLCRCAVAVCLSLGCNSWPADSPSAPILVWTGQYPVTTNAATSRSVASGATNFLVSLLDASNRVCAHLLNSAGQPVGTNIVLDYATEPPLVGFDGTNFLVAWASVTNISPYNADARVHGRYVSQKGEVIGSPISAKLPSTTGFVYESIRSLDDLEVQNNSFLLMGTYVYTAVSLSFDSQGIYSLVISNSENFSFDDKIRTVRLGQIKSPTLAIDGNRRLLSWLEQPNGFGGWRVMARFISAAISPDFTLNENPIYTPNGVTLCRGLTNYLVAWSRETGPFPDCDDWGTPLERWLPMVHGRLVSNDGVPVGNEFQITRAAENHYFPIARFDGVNYLVTWQNDGFKYIVNLPGTIGPYTKSINAQFLSPKGEPVGEPLQVSHWATSNINAAVCHANGKYLFVTDHLFENKHVQATMMQSDRQPSLLHLRLAPSHTGLLFTSESERGEALQFSTDLKAWYYYGDGSGPTRVRSGITNSLPMPSSANAYFRTIKDYPQCLENLRSIQRAKQQWALDRAKTATDTPPAYDLIGTDRYIKSPPICPAGGTYFFGDMLTRPLCTVIDHTLL